MEGGDKFTFTGAGKNFDLLSSAITKRALSKSSPFLLIFVPLIFSHIFLISSNYLPKCFDLD